MRYIIADTETTGLGPRDRVVELAWTEIDEHLNVIDQQYSLIDPEIPIPQAAHKVHGITNVMVATAPTIEEFFSTVTDQPLKHGEVVFIAHNAAFDLKFLRRFIGTLHGVLCTVRASRKLLPDLDSHKLDYLKEVLGLPETKSHSADGDVATTLELLRFLSEQVGGLPALYAQCSQPQRLTLMPWGKHKGVPIKALPADYVRWLLSLDDLDIDVRFSLTT